MNMKTEMLNLKQLLCVLVLYSTTQSSNPDMNGITSYKKNSLSIINVMPIEAELIVASTISACIRDEDSDHCWLSRERIVM